MFLVFPLSACQAQNKSISQTEVPHEEVLSMVYLKMQVKQLKGHCKIFYQLRTHFY